MRLFRENAHEQKKTCSKYTNNLYTTVHIDASSSCIVRALRVETTARQDTAAAAAVANVRLYAQRQCCRRRSASLKSDLAGTVVLMCVRIKVTHTNANANFVETSLCPKNRPSVCDNIFSRTFVPVHISTVHECKHDTAIYCRIAGHRRRPFFYRKDNRTVDHCA